MKTLLLIPSYVKTDLDQKVAADAHPTMDYQALAATLGASAGDRVELLDHGAVERDTSPVVRLTRRLAGKNIALAVMGFLRRRENDAIFTNAENLALPLALLLKAVDERPRHVTIAHRLSAKKKRPLYRWLKLHRQMDTIFVYSSAQRDLARTELGIPDEALRLIPFHADHRFFRPLTKVSVVPDQICSAGLEWRDYPTLVDAVEHQTDVQVKLAAASPWSKHSNELETRLLPPNVDARPYNYQELRDLYASSSFVVVPLYENDFQAGITTILEAMSMGKAVVTTGTVGQVDAVVDGQNGLYVDPGSVNGWRRAIDRLRNDHLLRARLGRAARRWVEENASLDRWVQEMVAALRNETLPAVGTRAVASAQSMRSEFDLRPPPAHQEVRFQAEALAEAVLSAEA